MVTSRKKGRFEHLRNVGSSGMPMKKKDHAKIEEPVPQGKYWDKVRKITDQTIKNE
jgi:hypothetical protein